MELEVIKRFSQEFLDKHELKIGTDTHKGVLQNVLIDKYGVSYDCDIDYRSSKDKRSMTPQERLLEDERIERLQENIQKYFNKFCEGY